MTLQAKPTRSGILTGQVVAGRRAILVQSRHTQICPYPPVGGWEGLSWFRREEKHRLRWQQGHTSKRCSETSAFGWGFVLAGLRRRNEVQRTGDGIAKPSSGTKFLNVLKLAAVTPRREAAARWSHTPRKRSEHPEHPVTPDRSGGMRNVRGFGFARLTWGGLLDLSPVCIRTEPLGRSR